VLDRAERVALRFSFEARVRIVTCLIFALLVLLLLQFHLDYQFTRDWLPFVLRGIPYTLLVATAAMLLAVVLALAGALGRLSKRALPYAVSSFYVSFIRGTPLIVQIFLWYSALPQLAPIAPPWARSFFVLPAVAAGILALGVNYGAYMTEIFRAGFQSIGHGQLEAAYAIGMSQTQATRRILLPQAVRVVIPAIGNEYIAMLKDSALVGLITVAEVFYRAKEVGNEYFKNLEMLIVAALIYWIMTIVFSTLQARVERRLARAYVR
jgi:polar amino acid transport system permease protein